VVNTAAAGIQQKNGVYITEYIPVTPYLIESMIMAKGSMGCYQQGYKTGYIKWICLDFDCNDKNDPDIEELHKEVIFPITSLLENKGIHFLTEYSGRRGIHIWIIFNQLIKKSLGFLILNEILRNVSLKQSAAGKWGLDKFPATDSSKNNTVGKQVKFPLSSHKAGGMAYFYRSTFEYRNDLYNDSFFLEQYEILHDYQENSINNVMEALGLHVEYQRAYAYKYKKYKVLDIVDITVDELWEVLTKTRVFNHIYHRMKRGQSLPIDWTVLLGTLSPCDKNANLLQAVLKQFPNYDVIKTENNLRRLKDSYYPASFGYLYFLYDLEIEKDLDPEMTGFEYLLKHLGIEATSLDSEMAKNRLKREVGPGLQDTVNKEIRYLLFNDESPDIYIWNQLHLIKKDDMNEMRQIVEKAISEGEYIGNVGAFRIFERHESEEKKRKLISLSAHDRIITTQLALELYHDYKKRWRSFSYRPSLTARKEIFYAWYQSWGNYIDRIRSFLKVPFFDEYEIIFIDLKGFYDHIDFLTVYKTLCEEVSEKSSNILRSLISYNDMLMTRINRGNRIGVPQGPAYARIIAEVFLDKILSRIEEKYEIEISILRYVDDITVICRPGFNSKLLFYELRDILSQYGLPLNMEKSRCYGMIKLLSDEQKKCLLHTDNFNYDLRNDSKDKILLMKERRQNLSHYLEAHSFDMRSLGYIFGSNTMQEAKEWCFSHYRKQIVSSRIGRGSNFRRFYEYVFRHGEYLNTLLEERLFELIPVDSVNFSNFVNTLYLAVQSHQIESNNLERIKDEFLSHINTEIIAKNDLAVLCALKMVHLEEEYEL